MGCVTLSTVACRSSMHSSRLDWVLGEARLISSARTTLAKMGPGPELELPALLVEDGHAGDVAGEQVGGELDAREAAVDGTGQRLGEQRLAHAGEVLHDDVTTGQERDHARPDDFLLAQDHRPDAGGDLTRAPGHLPHLVVLQQFGSRRRRRAGERGVGQIGGPIGHSGPPIQLASGERVYPLSPGAPRRLPPPQPR